MARSRAAVALPPPLAAASLVERYAEVRQATRRLQGRKAPPPEPPRRGNPMRPGAPRADRRSRERTRDAQVIVT